MQEQYAPTPGTAACPRCGENMRGAPVNHGALQMALLTWRCVYCGQGWDELHAQGIVTRYWEAPAATPLTSPE